LIFHPEVKYKNGRPLWLFGDSNRVAFNISLDAVSEMHFPVMAVAYYVNEPKSSVPADRLMIFDKSMKYDMCLLKGKYIFMIYDKNGDIIERKRMSLN